ncbi:MAG TPA: glycosyltransferase family 39 protein [Vicinamibacterales bacterium]|nr:glycosyltransferase family 39 protein [Vicinamibacterales bacterium]
MSSFTRSLVRTVALTLFAAGLLWVIAVALTGGFKVTIGGIKFSSQEPMRPLYWSTLPLLIFVWANGPGATAQTWSRWLATIDHRVAVAALTLVTLVLGVSFATTAAVASDQYGYVSQADLWLKGDLRLPQPWAAKAPWPDAARTFAPLAYRPAGTGTPTDIVPAYSPGLPWLMAAAKWLGGHGAVFWVVPIAGAVLVLTTWGIGRRWGSSAAGVIAALLVASSPAFWFLQVTPMADVPAAACSALCFYLLLRPGIRSGAAAGLAAGLAILIRPNLPWLAVPPGAWLLWHVIKAPRDSRRVATWRLLCFSTAIVAAAGVVGLVNARLYGSPLLSGYGNLGPLFALSNVPVNARRYLEWFVASQTPLIVVGLIAAVWPSRRIWPLVRDRAFLWVTSSCALALWTFYLAYLPFTDWWYLRFFLPTWPFIMLGLGAVLVAAARSSPTGLVTCTWLVVLLGVREFNDSRLRGGFDLWRADREFVAAAIATRDATRPSSVILSAMHSGSVRYYGGRWTLHYVWLDRAWLDRTVAWLDEHAGPTYALLRKDEVPAFKAQFAGAATLAHLDAAPVFIYPATGLALYALSAPAPDVTKQLTYDPHALRAVPPATMPAFGMK